MKLKYYLRGLSIGVIISVIFFTVYTNNRNQNMTDDEIRARAKELGMIENSILNSSNQTSNMEEDPTEPDEPTSQEEPADLTDSQDELDQYDISQEKLDDVTEPDNTELDSVETVTIIIERGDSSYTASKKLLEAGIIEDAKDFDQYLSQNGYDKKILTGSHEVPVTGTYEDFAKSITSK